MEVEIIDEFRGHVRFPENGDEYSGEWLDGCKHGRGWYLYNEQGWRFEGDFVKDERHGYGVLQDRDGRVLYLGEWVHDSCSGVGICNYRAGQYRGQWKNNQRHGFGVLVRSLPDEHKAPTTPQRTGPSPTSRALVNRVNKEHPARWSCFCGTWQQDKKHGFGAVITSEGEYFEGVYVNDVRNGWGVARASSTARGRVFTPGRVGAGARTMMVRYEHGRLVEQVGTFPATMGKWMLGCSGWVRSVVPPPSSEMTVTTSSSTQDQSATTHSGEPAVPQATFVPEPVSASDIRQLIFARHLCAFDWFYAGEREVLAKALNWRYPAQYRRFNALTVPRDPLEQLLRNSQRSAMAGRNHSMVIMVGGGVLRFPSLQQGYVMKIPSGVGMQLRNVPAFHSTTSPAPSAQKLLADSSPTPVVGQQASAVVVHTSLGDVSTSDPKHRDRDVGLRLGPASVLEYTKVTKSLRKIWFQVLLETCTADQFPLSETVPSPSGPSIGFSASELAGYFSDTPPTPTEGWQFVFPSTHGYGTGWNSLRGSFCVRGTKLASPRTAMTPVKQSDTPQTKPTHTRQMTLDGVHLLADPVPVTPQIGSPAFRDNVEVEEVKEGSTPQIEQKETPSDPAAGDECACPRCCGCIYGDDDMVPHVRDCSFLRMQWTPRQGSTKYAVRMTLVGRYRPGVRRKGASPDGLHRQLLASTVSRTMQSVYSTPSVASCRLEADELPPVLSSLAFSGSDDIDSVVGAEGDALIVPVGSSVVTVMDFCSPSVVFAVGQTRGNRTEGVRSSSCSTSLRRGGIYLADAVLLPNAVYTCEVSAWIDRAWRTHGQPFLVKTPAPSVPLSTVRVSRIRPDSLELTVSAALVDQEKLWQVGAPVEKDDGYTEETKVEEKEEVPQWALALKQQVLGSAETAEDKKVNDIEEEQVGHEETVPDQPSHGDVDGYQWHRSRWTDGIVRVLRVEAQLVEDSSTSKHGPADSQKSDSNKSTSSLTQKSQRHLAPTSSVEHRIKQSQRKKRNLALSRSSDGGVKGRKGDKFLRLAALNREMHRDSSLTTELFSMHSYKKTGDRVPFRFNSRSYDAAARLAARRTYGKLVSQSPVLRAVAVTDTSGGNHLSPRPGSIPIDASPVPRSPVLRGGGEPLARQLQKLRISRPKPKALSNTARVWDYRQTHFSRDAAPAAYESANGWEVWGVVPWSADFDDQNMDDVCIPMKLLRANTRYRLRVTCGWCTEDFQFIWGVPSHPFEVATASGLPSEPMSPQLSRWLTPEPTEHGLSSQAISESGCILRVQPSTACDAVRLRYFRPFSYTRRGHVCSVDIDWKDGVSAEVELPNFGPGSFVGVQVAQRNKFGWSGFSAPSYLVTPSAPPAGICWANLTENSLLRVHGMYLIPSLYLTRDQGIRTDPLVTSVEVHIFGRRKGVPLPKMQADISNEPSSRRRKSKHWQAGSMHLRGEGLSVSRQQRFCRVPAWQQTQIHAWSLLDTVQAYPRWMKTKKINGKQGSEWLLRDVLKGMHEDLPCAYRSPQYLSSALTSSVSSYERICTVVFNVVAGEQQQPAQPRYDLGTQTVRMTVPLERVLLPQRIPVAGFRGGRHIPTGDSVKALRDTCRLMLLSETIDIVQFVKESLRHQSQSMESLEERYASLCLRIISRNDFGRVLNYQDCVYRPAQWQQARKERQDQRKRSVQEAERKSASPTPDTDWLARSSTLQSQLECDRLWQDYDRPENSILRVLQDSGILEGESAQREDPVPIPPFQTPRAATRPITDSPERDSGNANWRTMMKDLVLSMDGQEPGSARAKPAKKKSLSRVKQRLRGRRHSLIDRYRLQYLSTRGGQVVGELSASPMLPKSTVNRRRVASPVLASRKAVRSRSTIHTKPRTLPKAHVNPGSCDSLCTDCNEQRSLMQMLYCPVKRTKNSGPGACP